MSKTLLERFKVLQADLFSRDYFIPSHELEPILTAMPLVRNGVFLLTGATGTGKSTLVSSYARRFFFSGTQPSLAKVVCHAELLDTDVLYRVPFSNPDGDAIPRAMLRERFRFVDEIARMNPVLQNAFLPFFAEQEILFRDQRFPVPNGVSFLCRNPDDVGQEGFVRALHDRVDQEVMIPDNSYPPRLIAAPKATSPLSTEDMEHLWEEVEQVAIEDPEWDYAHMLNYYFSACVELRSTANPLYELPCEKCNHAAEVCRQLRTTPGRRGIQSSFKLAKAIAWLDGRSAITTDDLEYTMPFTFGHRLDLHADVLRGYQNPQHFLQSFVIDEQVSAKRERWLESIDAKQQGDADQILQLARLTDDLVIGWLYLQASGNKAVASQAA